MKTIVIRPEIITYHTSAFRDTKPPMNKAVVACLGLLPVVALVGWLAGRSTSAPLTAPTAAPVVQKTESSEPGPTQAPFIARAADGAIELQTAVDQQLVKADFNGNGRERLTATLVNPSATSILVKVSFGQIFMSGKNTVVATHSAQTQIAAGQTATLLIPTAATRSINRIAFAKYGLSRKTLPKIDLLLTYAQDHPEMSAPVLQTAVLVLTENLPLRAVCKFAAAGDDVPSRFDTSAFRAETGELLAALTVLREIGVRDRDLAITIDPQLKIEAMIDPACRAAAMRYYGIASATEWNFWKSQLTEGDPATRHYALYGIARFYPDVALEMLPKWAREKRTTQIFRLTAVQALAETQRPEALSVLSSLVSELGRNTELGRAALDAATILDTTLRKGTDGRPTVAFRGDFNTLPF